MKKSAFSILFSVLIIPKYFQFLQLWGNRSQSSISNAAKISNTNTLKGIERHCADLGIDLPKLTMGAKGRTPNGTHYTSVIAFLEKKRGQKIFYPLLP